MTTGTTGQTILDTLSANSLPWLILLPLLPLAAAVLLPLTGSRRVNRVLAWTATLAAACCLVMVLSGFANSAGTARFAPFRCMQLAAWMPGHAVFAVGVDSLALPFLVLILLTLPLCLTVLRRAPDTRATACLTCVLVLAGALLAATLCLDMTLFCCLWAFIPCPLYLLLRLEAPSGCPDSFADSLTLVSLAAVIPLAAVVVALFPEGGVRFLPALLEGGPHPAPLPLALLTALVLAFLARTPLVPLHGPLMRCLQHAGPAARILLLGPLPALGVLVALRLFQVLGPISGQWALFWTWFAAVLMLYSGWAALTARDSARFLTHLLCGNMALILLGLSLGTAEARAGAWLHGLHLGLALGGLAFCLGETADRKAGGPANRRWPRRTCCLGLLILAACPLPGCAGFVGPALPLSEMHSPALRFCTGSGILVLTLALPRLLVLPGDSQQGEDMRIREMLVLVPVLVGLLGLGLGSRFLLDFLAPTPGLPANLP